MERFSENIRRYNYLSSEIDAMYHKLNVKLGLSDTASYILYTLNEDPDASQRDIAKRTGLSKQTVSSAVKKLVAAGILKPLSGRRGERLTLTDRGQAVMDEKIGVIVRIENAIFDSWDAEERERFIAMNEAYLKKLSGAVEKL